VTFDTGGDGLFSRGGYPIRGFAVAGADGRYQYADAVVDGESIVLRSEAVPAPLTVRYAWAGTPGANLVNRSGLPAAPFRTDSTTEFDADIQRLPVSRLVRMKSYEAVVGGNGSVKSLITGGKQFLANDPGYGGGATVSGWFGPRDLTHVREPGPGCVSCGDNDVGVVLEFGDKGLDWTVTNRSKEEIRFRIALHGKVAARRQGKGDPVELRRGAATVVVTGVDVLSDSESGQVLETIVGGGGSRRVGVCIGEK
jgi:hypothetical protein